MTAAVTTALNGAENGEHVSTITGRTVHEEVSTDKTFDVVMWIRARRLQ